MRAGPPGTPPSARSVETERLVLRPHRLEDFGACFAMWSDPDVTRFVGGTPSTEQQTWARLLGYAGHWSLLGFGYWALEEQATGDVVGELGFAEFKRDIAATMRDVPELGWALASHAWGKGYATEAVRAAVAWGDRHLRSARTVCLIDPENHASLRVARRCGYRVFARAAFRGRPTDFLDRHADRSPASC